MSESLSISQPSGKAGVGPVASVRGAAPRRSGLHTTEFWLTAAILLADFGLAVAGILPGQWAAILMTVSAAIYKIARLLLKLQAAGLTDAAIVALLPADPSLSANPVNSAPASPAPAVSADPMKIVPSLLLLGACAGMLAFSGCASSSGSSSAASARQTLNNIAQSPQAQAAFTDAAQILGDVATAALASAVQKEAGIKGVSATQSASQTLWTDINAINSSGQIKSLIASIGLPKTASAAASAAGASPTPAVTNAIASVISTASGAPPAMPPAKTSSLHQAIEHLRGYCARPFLHFRASACLR